MDHWQIRFCEGLSPRPSSEPTLSDFQQLQALFQAAAFWAQNRTVADLEIAITHSRPIISVWDQDHLIGFARATSDGIYRATIWDVVVHPEYRGAGLGRQLVQTVLAHPHLKRVERVYLMTTHHQNFYQRIGFETNTSVTLVLYQTAESSLPSLVVEATQ